jgi:hypothetical protein
LGGRGCRRRGIQDGAVRMVDVTTITSTVKIALSRPASVNGRGPKLASLLSARQKSIARLVSNLPMQANQPALETLTSESASHPVTDRPSHSPDSSRALLVRLLRALDRLLDVGVVERGRGLGRGVSSGDGTGGSEGGAEGGTHCAVWSGKFGGGRGERERMRMGRGRGEVLSERVTE